MHFWVDKGGQVEVVGKPGKIADAVVFFSDEKKRVHLDHLSDYYHTVGHANR